MKFNLKDFLELDTKSLLAVNGGTDCSGSSSPSSPSDSGGGGSGGPGSSTTSSSGSGSGGGGCSNTPSKPTTPTTPKSDGSNSSTSSGGGGCSGTTSTPPTTDDTNGGSKDSSSDNIKSKSERKNPDGTITKITSYDDGTTITKTYDAEGNHISGMDQKYCPKDTKGEKTQTGESVTTNDTTSGDSNSLGSTDTTVTESGTTNTTNDSQTDSPTTGIGLHSGVNGSTTSNPSIIDNKEDNSSTQPTKIVATGTFGQITDGSYADELTMQYYKDGKIEINPFYTETSEMAKLHDFEMNGNRKFSEEGCLMTATAKIVSELSGKEVYLREVNDKFDKNLDGLLSSTEIKDGINNYLDDVFGDIYDVKSETIEGKDLSITKLSEVSSKSDGTTYVLGYAPDCYSGHWVLLEGYSQDSSGKIIFDYEGSSNNDVGRTYILGTENQDFSSKKYGITKIQSFTISEKN